MQKIFSLRPKIFFSGVQLVPQPPSLPGIPVLITNIKKNHKINHFFCNRLFWTKFFLQPPKPLMQKNLFLRDFFPRYLMHKNLFQAFNSNHHFYQVSQYFFKNYKYQNHQKSIHIAQRFFWTKFFCSPATTTTTTTTTTTRWAEI